MTLKVTAAVDLHYINDKIFTVLLKKKKKKKKKERHLHLAWPEGEVN